MYTKIFIFIFLSFILTACSNQKKLPDSCYKVGKPGMCRAYFEKYYFNWESEKCEKFIYGGCGGEVPFQTLIECKETCEE